MTKVKNQIPDKLRALMREHQIKTQREMADKLGMDEGAFSRLLRMSPSNLVSIDLLNSLYNEFGVTPNDLLLDSDET